MKKSELREAIRSIVKRKLSEQVTISHGENGKVIDAIAERSAGPKTARFAYIPGEQKGEKDPQVTLVGYGQMSLSSLKAKLIDDLHKMVGYATNGKVDAVVSQWDNITELVAKGLAELEGGQVTEAVAGAALSATNPAAVAPVNAPADPELDLTQADQDKVDKLMAEKNKLQQELEQIRGQTAKLTEPFEKKTLRINKRIADINAGVNRISGK